MSDPVTIEDIYQLFRTSGEEFDRRLRESDRRAEEAKLESDRHRAEIERILAQSKLESDRYAYKKGLFVIKSSGDTVTIINDSDFQPMTW